ncbi:MAG: carbamoyltransferase [Gallionella sp.]
MYILGISAFYHDSAACLLKDGEIIAAAQEERFTRKKHDYHFPHKAIQFCLKQAGITVSEIDYVSYYEKPRLKFDRLLKTYLAYAPMGLGSFVTSMPLWIKEKLWMDREIRRELGYQGPLICPEHHQSHAASAFFPSPFDRAAVLTMDGVGEWATLSYGVGNGNSLKIDSEIRFPHSLGLLYSAFTYYTGFKVNSGEYKLMGLAPYGDPVHVDTIYKHLIDLKEDGSFRLNMDYFNYCTGFTMTSARFHELFGRAPRRPESEISKLDMDLARSIQVVTEEIVLRIGRHVHRMTGEKNLCLAGGVALNCVSNGRLYREGPFERIWIQPAAGDAGGALGAALHVWHNELGKARVPQTGADRQFGSYLGTEYSDSEIEAYLKENEAIYTKLSESDRASQVARVIADGNVVGWFNGRMEFGPRALGARSILGDPRSSKMQSVMNLKIKFRESFRPFAPAVLAEKLKDWFDMSGVEQRSDFSSPYMLIVGRVKKDKLGTEDSGTQAHGFDRLKKVNSQIPAVTHVDNSARLQTVHEETNPAFYHVLKAFDDMTGCPVIINTSFNVRGEPIVESPEDAYRCFMRTEMDYLVLGSFLLNKKDQPEFMDHTDWKSEFQLD